MNLNLVFKIVLRYDIGIIILILIKTFLPSHVKIGESVKKD